MKVSNSTQKGDIKKEGTDVTIIAWNKALPKALEAAEQLEKENISVEVLDPRTLQPLDEDLIFESSEKLIGYLLLKRHGVLLQLVHKLPTEFKKSASII